MNSVLSAQRDLTPLQQRAEAQQQPLALPSLRVQRGALHREPQPAHSMQAWMRAMLQYSTDS